MGVTVVMPVGMGMVVMGGVGRGGNHSATLYYNITSVHGRSGLADQHCDGSGHERERH